MKSEVKELEKNKFILFASYKIVGIRNYRDSICIPVELIRKFRRIIDNKIGIKKQVVFLHMNDTNLHV